MRISDCSSDVCSSDLLHLRADVLHGYLRQDVLHRLVRRRPPRRADGHLRRQPPGREGLHPRQARGRPPAPVQPVAADHRRLRSEEHTSELQSLIRSSYAVFCLKTKTDTPPHDTLMHTTTTSVIKHTT